MNMNIMVGGEAGQGVQSVGMNLAKTLAHGGLKIFADQDYESRVRGGHNFFRIRTGSRKLEALAEKLDILVALNGETIDLHTGELNRNGIVIYDGDQNKITDKGNKYFNVPLLRLAEDTVQNRLMSNSVAAGAVIGITGYKFDILADVIKREFARHGEEVIGKNVRAAKAGYKFASENGKQKTYKKIKPITEINKQLLLNGNEAIALGAMAGGCRFIAAYPMTPASSIMEYMANQGREYGVVAIHVEDEIAAMNMAVGAGYAGARAMVATSGGGFSLMVEGLALAGMTETPVVTVLAQRPGPATGLPTRTEQGELWFALHSGHGEFPRALLAPATAEEAFHAAVKAFNLAEKYQTPVFILTDHHLATSYTTVDRFNLSQVKVDRGELLSAEESDKISDYRRYKVTNSGISPRALPGQGKALVVADSDEHDEAGHMIEDAATRKQQNLKRLRKQKGLAKEIVSPKVHQAAGAELTLVGWGSTYGAIKEAAALLRKDGLPVNILHLSQIWPFPARTVAAVLKKTKKSVAIEGNATAQLAGLIRRETGYKLDSAILKYDGRPFSPEEIVSRLRREV